MDFHIVKNASLGANHPYLFDERSRTTKISSKSPRVNGVLKLRENPYDVTNRQTFGTTCVWGVSTSSPPSYPYGVTGVNYPPEISSKLGSLINNAQKQAIEIAYSKVANIQMSLAEAVKERVSTLQTIIQRAKQIKNLYNNLKKGKLPPIPKKFKKDWENKSNLGLSQLWLEYSFMWVPLVQDIQTLAEGIQPINGVYVKGHATVFDSHKVWSNLNIGANKAFRYAEVFSQRRVKATCKLWVTLDDPLVAVQSEMGLLTPVSVWNIMPFSFVVDWFFRIGALFERLCFPGKTITQGSVTTLVDDNVYTYGRNYGEYATLPDKTIVKYVTTGSGVTAKTQWYYRTIGVPSPFFITTSFNQLSWWNVGTTWALLSTIFSKS